MDRNFNIPVNIIPRIPEGAVAHALGPFGKRKAQADPKPTVLGQSGAPE